MISLLESDDDEVAFVKVSQRAPEEAAAHPKRKRKREDEDEDAHEARAWENS